MDKEHKDFFKNSIKDIRKALDENYLSIFAGAGISADSGLPQWSDLMKDIAGELNEEYKGDNLVLAQKFYLKCGKKCYYEKLNDFIPSDKEPNGLHKKIVKLNLKNLITTNWDNLFEKAINDEGCFYKIIKEDKDIGSPTGFSRLIKMHGDLESKNIVFKEEDYLKYSDNFPLIENYIKSVFSTDTVVLMGYSLSDYNVKQIISWVNSKSDSCANSKSDSCVNSKPDNSQTKIYLTIINKEFNQLDFDYYENKNIHVLYLSEIYEGDSKKVLNSFLDDLDKNYCDLDESNSQKINEEVEEFLQKYKVCKFVLASSFIRDFKSYFLLVDNTEGISFDSNRNLISIHNNKLIEFVKEENYKKIANLTKTEINVKGKYIKPDYDEKEYIEDIEKMKKNKENILYFDYDAIEKEIEELLLKDLKDEEELSLAFWLYQNEHYIRSYGILKKVSKNAFKNGNYTTWFISEINRANFVFKNINKDEIRNYLKEIIKIDTEELYLKLPKKNRFEIQSLKELESFIDKNMIKTYELKEKISRDYNTYKNGGFSMNDNIKFARNIFFKTLYLEMDLKLINSGEVYENATKSFLIYRAYEGLMKEKRENEKSIVIDIDIFLFSFAIKYVKVEDLKTIFKEYFKPNYALKLGDNEGINKIYKNICKKFTKSGFYSTTCSQSFNRFLIFSSYMILTQENFDLIIEKFIEKLESSVIAIEQFENMSYFLSEQHCKNKNINFSSITAIIEKYINDNLSGKPARCNVEDLSQPNNIFNITFDILIHKNIKLETSFNPKITEFIANLKNKNLEVQCQAGYFLVKLARVVTEDMQKEIDELNLKIYYQAKNENRDYT